MLVIIATFSETYTMPDQFLGQFDHFPDYIWDPILRAVAIVIGFIVKFMLSLILRRKPRGTPHFSATRAILSRLGTPMSYFLPLLAFNFLLPRSRMKHSVTPAINKTVEILLTASFANVLIAVIKIFEAYVYHTYDIQK